MDVSDKSPCDDHDVAEFIGILPLEECLENSDEFCYDFCR